MTEPGKCSECGMDLVLAEPAAAPAPVEGPRNQAVGQVPDQPDKVVGTVPEHPEKRVGAAGNAGN